MRPIEQRLIDLELAQHGLVALDQLAGDWTGATIRHHVYGRRTRRAPRVFANPSVSENIDQRLLAAVLTAGPGAFASHETAAQLLELPLPGPALLELSTSHKRRPLVAGAHMHRSAVIDEADIVVVRGIRITGAPLTIYSLSSRFSITQVGRMADDAVRRGLTTLDDLAEIVERLRPAHGRSRKKMRVVLERRLPDVEQRESDLEDFVVGAIIRFDLPIPVAQYPIDFRGHKRRIDLCYPDDWLALEAKGFKWYKSRSVFDRDALRGNELQLAGFRVLSFTSAFTDWEIACHIADALRRPRPAPQVPRSYADWSRDR